MLNYFSIDLETLSTEPETGDIVEFGAVYDDLSKPFSAAETFHCYILPPLKLQQRDYYVGTAMAMAMNAEILKLIGKHLDSKDPNNKIETPPGLFLDPFDVGVYFTDWIWKMTGGSKYTAAGKNFSMFDWGFLKPIKGFPKPRHRVLDLGSLVARVTDKRLPNTSEVMQRCGIVEDSSKKHTALYDAQQVCRAIRNHFQVAAEAEVARIELVNSMPPGPRE